MMPRILLPLAALLLLAHASTVSAGYCSMGVFARVGACGRFVDVDVGAHKLAGTRPLIVCPLSELDKPDHIHAWVVIGDRHTGDFTLNGQSFPFANHGTQELATLARGSKIVVGFENKHTDIVACKGGDPQRLPLFCERCSTSFEVDIKFEGDLIAGASSQIVARVADHLPGAPRTCDLPVTAKLWTCGGRTFTFHPEDSNSDGHVTVRCPRRFLNTISPLTASLSSAWITNLVGRAGVFRINGAKFRRQNRGGMIVRLKQDMIVSLRFRTRNGGEQDDSKCNSAKLNVKFIFEDAPPPAPATASPSAPGSSPSPPTPTAAESEKVTEADPLEVPTGSYAAPPQGDDSADVDAGADKDAPTQHTTPPTGASSGSTGAKSGDAAAAARSSTGTSSAGAAVPLTPPPPTQSGADTSRPTTQSSLPATVIPTPTSSAEAAIAERGNSASKPMALSVAAVVAVICAMMMAV